MRNHAECIPRTRVRPRTVSVFPGLKSRGVSPGGWRFHPKSRGVRKVSGWGGDIIFSFRITILALKTHFSARCARVKILARRRRFLLDPAVHGMGCVEAQRPLLVDIRCLHDLKLDFWKIDFLRQSCVLNSEPPLVRIARVVAHKNVLNFSESSLHGQA